MDSLFASDDDDNMFDLDGDASGYEEASAEKSSAADLSIPEPVEVTPRDNPDLFGHEDTERALLADFNAGRMPHAIILAGPVGIGKATLAYRLARFLLSQEPDRGAGLFGEAPKPQNLFVSPLNPLFRRVASGGHADLLVIEREFDEKKNRLKTEISVDAVRRAHPFVRKTAAEEGWRVIIVDSAEYLNRNSQNALLKILEEPPSKTLLILTTSQPGSFLPTIRSRCRMVPMRPLSENVLDKLLDRFSPGSSPAEKTALARLSEGSIGKALQYKDGDGLALYKILLKIIGTLPTLDVPAVHDLADQVAKSEQAYETVRELLTVWCERLTRLQARGLPITDVLPGDGDIFRRLLSLYPPRHFLDTWDKVSHLFLQTEIYNLDKRMAVINAFLMLQNPAHQALAADR